MKKETELLNKLTHTIKMMKSHDVMTIACDGHFIKMLEETRDCLNRWKPKQIEIEGGGSNWWYVCPECHGAIDRQDHFCRHCGQALMKM